MDNESEVKKLKGEVFSWQAMNVLWVVCSLLAFMNCNSEARRSDKYLGWYMEEIKKNGAEREERAQDRADKHELMLKLQDCMFPRK